MALVDLKNSTIKGLVKDIKLKCKLHDITFLEIKKRHINVGTGSISGYFDHSRRELGVAFKNSMALEVLIHESCHLDQFVSGCDAWINLNIPYKGNVIESSYLFDLWLSNIVDIDNDLLEKITKKIMDNERDCEKRSILKIKKYKLDQIISLEDYIQKSNAYILGYNLVKKNRRWFDKSPYMIPYVYETFPKKTIINYYSLKKTQHDILNKHCF